ncbi:helix-hairpin-helix domain-containing protein [Frischella sp. Ac48]|uniref:Helix-hairpin-helix domain-containing protein n=1 Tax=Frischella japonica TaxID=2741544 RepID=A0ABR7QZN3_9GAMM|nr:MULTISPECIES: helix-hairpin-helix domain-containing protein [Frischella]MBC9131600.1 helix-hairpin-helix domain-containing protein [Frischella japonica]MBX4134046.1 helix-hairpin-helix domain-containing protein [Frischella sp. Ac48]
MKKFKVYFNVIILLLLTINLSPTAMAEQQTSENNPPNQIAQMATVNINTASAEELVKGLNGIGLNKAKKIIEYRDKFGPFVTIEQLKEVSGIGQSILDRNNGKISL